MSEEFKVPSAIDPIAEGDKIMKSITPLPSTEEEEILNYLREQWKMGAVIRATNPEGDVLARNSDGTWNSGLTFQYPGEAPKPDTI